VFCAPLQGRSDRLILKENTEEVENETFKIYSAIKLCSFQCRTASFIEKESPKEVNARGAPREKCIEDGQGELNQYDATDRAAAGRPAGLRNAPDTAPQRPHTAPHCPPKSPTVPRNASLFFVPSALSLTLLLKIHLNCYLIRHL